MFADRAEAGRLLAEKLASVDLARPLVVLALPRGGAPVGAEIARRLGAPLDVVLVRKLGAPHEPELAIGAVANGTVPEIVLNAKLVHALHLDEDYITGEVTRELAAIAQRRQEYEGLRSAVKIDGSTVIVVDDGVATGMTMQAALRSLRRKLPLRLIVAAPVASRDAARMLRRESDQVVCLATPRRFGSVGAYYRSFAQVSDLDVAALLRDATARILN